MKSKAERMSEARIRIHRRKKEQAERRASSQRLNTLPVGTPRVISSEERKERLIKSLDPNKLGDSFIISEIDGLFIGCSNCKSSIRHVMNRWDIDEDPEPFMIKIDRVAQTIYKKQPASAQMNLTVKEVAIKLINHIESTRNITPKESKSNGQVTKQITIEG
jgi:hypothetical protein